MLFPENSALQVERGPRLFGYGSDSGGGRTAKLLQYLSNSLGPVSSFTGTYQADKWFIKLPGMFGNSTRTLGHESPELCVYTKGM